MSSTTLKQWKFWSLQARALGTRKLYSKRHKACNGVRWNVRRFVSANTMVHTFECHWKQLNTSLKKSPFEKHGRIDAEERRENLQWCWQIIILIVVLLSYSSEDDAFSYELYYSMTFISMIAVPGSDGVWWYWWQWYLLLMLCKSSW